MFAPENGNMLGGVMVNLTGPCFEPGTRVTCRFEPETVSVSSHMGNEEMGFLAWKVPFYKSVTKFFF